MKNMATLSSILKKHYTYSEREVVMLTFIHLRIDTLAQGCTCTHIQIQKYTNTAHSFFSFYTYPTLTQGMLSQIITGGLSLSLVAAACE